jgi:hypothetical protein
MKCTVTTFRQTPTELQRESISPIVMDQNAHGSTTPRVVLRRISLDAFAKVH